MARPLRIEYPNAWYHVINRGRHRNKIFFSDEDYQIFLDLLGRCHTLFELDIHAYSLMPNHYHLLVSTPRANLARCMRHLDGVYTQQMNRKYRKDGTLFKGRYKAMLIEKEQYQLEVIRYIHRNPLKAKLVQRMEDHPWTSHRAYLQAAHQPPWLEKDSILQEFGTDREQAQRAFCAFVDGKPDEFYEKEVSKSRWPCALGTPSFKAWVKETFVQPKKDQKEIPQITETLRSADPEALLKRVCQEVPCSQDTFKKPRLRAYSLPRRAYVYLAREHLKLPCRDLGDMLGGLTFPAVSKLYRQALEDINEKKGCYVMIEKLQETLKFKVKT
jgi:putative transposase